MKTIYLKNIKTSVKTKITEGEFDFIVESYELEDGTIIEVKTPFDDASETTKLRVEVLAIKAKITHLKSNIDHLVDATAKLRVEKAVLVDEKVKLRALITELNPVEGE